MKFQLGIRHRGLIIVLVPLLLVFVLLGGLASLLYQAEAEIQREEHAREVVMHANIFLRQLVAGASHLLAYYLDKNPASLRMYKDRRRNVRGEMLKLAKLLHDEPDQLAQLEKTDQDVQRMFEVSSRMAQAAGEATGIFSMLHGKEYFTEIYSIIDKVSNDVDPLLRNFEQMAEASPAAQARSRDYILAVIYGGMATTLIVAFYLTSLFSKGITGRLQVLTDNTGRLAKQQPLAAPIGGSDEIAQLDTFFHKMARDLAEAMRKERAILDNAVDVICSINADGFFTAANPASLQVWGFAPDKLVGMPFSAIVVEQDVEKFRSAISEIKKEKSRLDLETGVVSPDKGVVYILWSLNWSEPEQSLFCVAHDISDRKEVERLKQEFVAVISHELRTPLTSLQGTLTLLLDGVYGQLTEMGDKRLQGAERSISRLIMLINDLLDIEKMEAGKLSMHYAEANLAEIIERSIEAVQGFAEQQGVRLTSEKKSEMLLVDSNRIVQVMVNLLSNAIKFSDDGAQVEVTVADADNFAEVRIIDHGTGIPPGAEKTIFEKYEQAHAPGSERRKGTGLGLPICKAIVEQHGGNIGVRGTEGGGSTFWFQLPRTIAD